MRTQVSRAQIDFYRKQGYIVIEGFLDARELETWRKITDEAVEMRVGRPAAPERERGGRGTLTESPNNQATPNDFYAKVFTQCLRLADTHPGMRELIYHCDIGKLCGELAGVEGIRVWHDQALYKPPWGNPTAFHLDDPFWSFSSRDALSIWIALDDATLHNGCLYYLPGTHATARFDNVGIGQNVGGLFSVYPEWREIEAVPAACSAGSAVIHNGLIAHGAGANMTPRPRRAMTCAYMPDGCTFNGTQNILPEAYFKSLKIGDVLNDPRQNPLIWSRIS